MLKAISSWIARGSDVPNKSHSNDRDRPMKIIRAELVATSQIIGNDPPVLQTVLGPILNGRVMLSSVWRCEFEDGSQKEYLSEAPVIAQLAPNATLIV